MSDKNNIYTALATAQASMGRVIKGAVNPHFKSRYADLADVMAVALPALTEQGICVWHSMHVQDGRDYMRTTLSHGASDTSISCDVPLVNVKQDMQGMKSATTYAKRIGIESLAGIAPEDDDGNAAVNKPTVDPMTGGVNKAAPYWKTATLRNEFTKDTQDKINAAKSVAEVNEVILLVKDKLSGMREGDSRDELAVESIQNTYKVALSRLAKPAVVAIEDGGLTDEELMAYEAERPSLSEAHGLNVKL